MLSRKTLGVAGAAMLGAIAFLGTNVASAVIDLEDGMGKVKYAKETLTTDGEFMMDGVQYYTVTNGANMLNMSGKVGFNPSTSVPVYVRFDLMNMVFAGTNLGDESLTGAGGGASTSRTAGGTGGTESNDSWVIFTVAAVGDGSDVVTLEPTGLGVTPDQPGSAKMRVYFEVTDALTANDDYYRMKEVQNAVSVTSGVKVTVTKGTDVADVAERFEEFVDRTSTVAAGVGLVGTIMVEYDASTLNAVGSTAVGSIQTVYATADTTITVAGDFSYAVGQHHASEDGCALGGENNLSSTTGMVMLTLAHAEAAGGASVCLEEAEDMQIPTTRYMVTVKFAKASSANAFAAPEFMDELGRFLRNGTTVHIPYMTIYDGYNQRLVLSNRGARDASYEITFRPEEGVMATAMDMAMGTLMAGATVTMRAADLVMLEGGSRTAATIDVVARPDDIDVSSVIVNKDGGGTDTVVHHSMN